VWLLLSSSVWCPEDKNSLTVTHACCKRRLKWVPFAWGYSWVTLSPSVTITEAWSSRLGVGRGVDSPTPVRNLLSGNPRKAMAHKRLSCQRWWWLLPYQQIYVIAHIICNQCILSREIWQLLMLHCCLVLLWFSHNSTLIKRCSRKLKSMLKLEYKTIAFRFER
jgi:hypothetical protein